MRTFVTLFAFFVIWALTTSGIQAQTIAAADDYYTTTLGTPIFMPVLLNDFSITGYFGEVLITTPPISGAEVVSLPDGVLSYLPAEGFVGEDVFTYTVSNDLGATASAVVYVTVIAGCPDLYAYITTTTPILCNGVCNGSAVLSVWGGTPPYTITWTDFLGTGYVINNLCAGAYTTTVTDATGCSTVSNIYLAEAAPTTVNVSVNPPVIGPGGFALLQATISGGAAPYTYQWSPTTWLVNTSAANPIASPPATTTYVVTVTDSNGCIASGFGIVVVDTGAGAVTANDDYYETPSAGPFTMNVLDNDVYSDTVAPTIIDTPNNGTATASGAFIIYVPNPGFSGYDTLQYIICNAFSVCSTATVVIYVNTGGSGCSSLLAEVSAANTQLCYNTCTGSATVTAWGGTPPYAYTWSNGSTLATAANLCAGTNTVVVTDAAGCTTNQSVIFTETPPLVATAVATPAEITIGQTTQLNAAASGGTPPYSYQWMPSAGLNNPLLPNPIASPNFTTTYLLTVTDANGCTAQYPLVVMVTGGGCDLTPIVNVTMPVCFGECAGSLAASVVGGTPPFTYQWTGPDGFTSTATFITGLCPGIYTLLIADAMGCIINQAYTITALSPLLAISTESTPVQIPAGGSATITSTTTGGTPPYTYLWNTGQTSSSITITDAGTYCISVTDSNGCTDEECRTVTAEPVTPLNAQDDFVYAETGQTLTINPLANDTGTNTLTLLTVLATIDVNVDYENGTITLTAPDEPGAYLITYLITDATGTVATGTITLTVLPPAECVEDCVWPGDANNDGIANNYDVLNLGLAYDFTGTARLDQSIGWYAHSADNWANNFANGLNFKFADCNGNGTINAQDTTAISLNYGLTHGKNTDDTQTGAPLFFSLSNQTGTGVGDTISLWIHLGNAANPVTDFYGIAYTLNYDGAFLQLAHLTLANDAWVGNTANTLLFKKTTSANQTDVALTRTNQTNTSGQGIVGKASFVIIENIDGKNEENLSYTLNFSITSVRCITNAEAEIPVNPENYTLTATTDNTLPSNAFFQTRIYPNPAQNLLHINAPAGAVVQVYNLTGQLICQQQLTTPATTLSVHTWQKGMYLLTISTSAGKKTYKLLVQ